MLYLVNYTQEGIRKDCVDEYGDFPPFVEAQIITATNEQEARKAFAAQFIATYSPIRIVSVARIG
jgi:hypothetical protein